MFEGFELCHVEVPGGRLRLRRGGKGPPLLLLHGNPQTHAMWHRVAPTLARRFSVVCPDLRGYGGSFKPDPSPDQAARPNAVIIVLRCHLRGLARDHERKRGAGRGYACGGREAFRAAHPIPHFRSLLS